MLCFDPDKRLRMHEVMPWPCLGLCDAQGQSLLAVALVQPSHVSHPLVVDSTDSTAGSCQLMCAFKHVGAKPQLSLTTCRSRSRMSGSTQPLSMACSRS